MSAADPVQCVLAIDTAGPVIGVALLVGDVLTMRTERVRRGAEVRLVPWAKELCAEAGIGLKDLAGVAVATGPGAFTGIRVGMATAVGLGLGLGIPLLPCSSLDSRAARIGAEGTVLAMLDARKSRVYAALYVDGQCLEGPGDIDPSYAMAWVAGPFTATGEGAAVYADLIEASGGVLAAEPTHPAVDALARLGAAALSRGEGVDASQVAPTYLRAPDAKPPEPRGSG